MSDTDAKHLEALARLITGAEDRLAAALRPQVLELSRQLRQLLAQLGPSTAPAVRSLLYSRLRPQLLALLQRLLVNPYYAALREALLAVEPKLLPLTERLLRLPKATLVPSPLDALLATTAVLGRPTSALLAPDGSGISPLTLQLERLLNTTVQSATMREEPLAALLASVGPSAPSRSGAVPKGTAANAIYDRLQATGAAVLWSLNTTTVARAAKAISRGGVAPTGWRWNAVLDPRTCPVCRPLHDTFAPELTDFPLGPPPLHPRCRCVALPTFPL